MGSVCYILISLALSSIVSGDREKRQILNWDAYANAPWNTVDGNNSLTIYYKIDSTFTSATRIAIIRDGMRAWQDRTCINIVEVPLTQVMDKHYILFTNNPGGGCISDIGMTQSELEQTINMEESACFGPIPGRFLHEVGHALGLRHEHQRYDRDDVITVDTSNVSPGYSGDYIKLTTSQIRTYDVPYDISSVMHYHATAFAIDTTKYVMTALDPRYQRNMGNNDGLTFFDAKIINIEYCADACAGSMTQCARGGYPDPRDCSRCHCIEGFKDLCNTVDDSDLECPDAGVVDVTSEDWTCAALGPYQWDRTCNWHLKAAPGKTIDFKFDETAPFDVYCGNEAMGFPCRHYVEVKYKGQLDRRGPRVCCNSSSTFNGADGYVTSENNEILVTFRSVMKRTATYDGFTMCYRVTESRCEPGFFGDLCQFDAKCLQQLPENRASCGFAGVTKWQCLNEGCCFDKSIRKVNWCFQPLDVADLGPIMEVNSQGCDAGLQDPTTRVNCGYVGIPEQTCRARNCCWHELHGYNWCFYPTTAA